MPRPGNVLDGENTARFVARLRQPQQQLQLELEFVIDGTSLQQLLRDLPVPEPETYGFAEPFELVSVANLACPDTSVDNLWRLIGDVAPDEEHWPLAPGRLPLYVCPIDGDLSCGAVTVSVTHGPAETTWSDFRLEDGTNDDEAGLDLSALGPFTFSRAAYRLALLEPVAVLDTLATKDQEAELAYRRNRIPHLSSARYRRAGVALARVGVGAMFILLAAVSVVSLPLAARAAFGVDTVGTFVVQATTCPGPDCSSRGTWYADRSTRVVSDAEMFVAPSDARVGEVVPAIYLGETDPASVYPADEDFTWLYVLALAGLVPAAVLVALGLRAERRRDARVRGAVPRRAIEESL